MIQRIQSLWLLIASLFSFATLRFAFYAGSDNTGKYVEFNANDNFFVLILTIVVAAALLVNIFLYKDRKMQLKITIATLVVYILTLILAFSKTTNFLQGKFALTSVIYFAIPVFIFLAARAIYKDEKLVKSADKLR